jgi:hypothetical protein
LRVRDTAPPRRAIPLALVSVGIVALAAGVSAGPEEAAVGALVLLAGCVVALRDIKTPVFTWQNALIGLLMLVWLVPSRQYTLSVSLPFNLELYRAALFLLVFAWAVALLARRSRVDAAGHGRAVAALAIVTVLSFLANIGDLEQAEGVKALSFLLSYLAVFLLVASTIETTAQAQRIVAWIVVGATIVSVAALYEGTTGYNVFDHLDSWIPALDQLPRDVEAVRGGRLRVQASSQHAIALGCALVMCVPLAAHLARWGASRMATRAWAACGLVIAAGAAATISRTTVIMTVVMLGVGLYLYRSRLLRYWPVLIVLAVAIHLAAPGAIGGLYKSFVPEEGLVGSVSGRAGQLGSGRLSDVGPGIELWKEKPLLGHGPGTSEIVIDDPRDVSLGQLPPEIYFDNQYMNTLVTLGALGTLVTLWFVWGAARKTVTAARRATGREASLLAACGLAASGFAAGMLFFDAFAFVQATLVFVAVAALGLRVAAVVAAETVEATGREPARRERPGAPSVEPAG